MGDGKAAARSYAGLDLIRFAAALAVAFYHLSYFCWLPYVSGTRTSPIIVEPFRWGWIGVPVFFVLSGFVIAFSANGRSVSEFVVSRALRLYPAAWICGTMTFLALAATRPISPQMLGGYARAMILSSIGPWISVVYWTLAVEIVFYALIAVALARRWRLTSVAMALGLASSAFWCLRLLDFATGGHLKNVFSQLEGPIGNLSLAPFGCYFAIGIALFGITENQSPKAMRALLGVCTLSALIAVTEAGRSHIFAQGGRTIQAVEPAIFWLLAWCAILASVKWNGLIWDRWGGLARHARIVGLMTYPLYLLHHEIGRILMLELPPPRMATLFMTVGGLTTLSFAVVALERYPRSALKAVFNFRGKGQMRAADLP